MSATLQLGQQLAAAGGAYQSQLIDLNKQDEAINARYGAAGGALDFIDPKDPFSVTGTAKRLFREQQESRRYNTYGQGYGLDGANVEGAARLGVAQDQRRRDITDDFNAAHASVNSARSAATGGWGETQASLNAQIAQAFADDNNATLGGAAPAAAGVGESGYAVPAAPTAAAAAARAGGQTKAARGFLWRLNSDGKTWTKIRPLNAFGQ